MIRKYDHSDYIANKGKYSHFKTAIVAYDLITHNGEQDIPAGTHVGIQFRCEAFNALYRRHEPVYSIAGKGIDLYANNLADFVL